MATSPSSTAPAGSMGCRWSSTATASTSSRATMPTGRSPRRSRATRSPTHFGRMLQALGIGFIRAHSPQAKGRIERLWDTLQDRLTSELRLRGISTLEAGNAFLPEFLADFTRRFAQPPADTTPAWRPVPRDLAELLSCRYPRTVARDNTVRLGARWVQIPPRPPRALLCRLSGRRPRTTRWPPPRLYHDTLLASQPSPDPAFVLKPREGPGQARREPRRGSLRHALGELGRAAPPAVRAVSRRPRAGLSRPPAPPDGPTPQRLTRPRPPPAATIRPPIPGT